VPNATSDVSVDTLIKVLNRNRFMPAPSPDLSDIGDGDFMAIGLEFLRHFVKVGGLRPRMRVLDIGCGLGRIAMPLTQYLDDAGSYFGFDVSRPAIDWCQETITPRYPNFRFAHLDWLQPLYNPGGSLHITKKTRLPIRRGPYDFVIMTSVLTHLSRYDMQVYLSDLPRLLAPDGVVFATMFLLDEGRLAARNKRPLRYDFVGKGMVDKGMYYLDPVHPHAAVAHEAAAFEEELRRFGLRVVAPVRYGNWDGIRRARNFQDICLFGRRDVVATLSEAGHAADRELVDSERRSA